MEVEDTLGERRLWSRLNLMAPDKAGEEGWSVAVTVDAWARAQTTDGSAAPEELLVLYLVKFRNTSEGVKETDQRLVPTPSLPSPSTWQSHPNSSIDH